MAMAAREWTSHGATLSDSKVAVVVLGTGCAAEGASCFTEGADLFTRDNVLVCSGDLVFPSLSCEMRLRFDGGCGKESSPEEKSSSMPERDFVASESGDSGGAISHVARMNFEEKERRGDVE